MSERIVDHQCDAAEMRSPLAWALLGLIVERPGHGYDLAQRFTRTYGKTLILSSRATVYRLLDNLNGHGLIEETETGTEEKPAPNRQPKPHFAATAKGKRAYEEWLLAQLNHELQRSRLFARQLGMLEPEAALEVLDRYEEEYLEEADQDAPPDAEDDGGIGEQLAYEDERITLGAKLSWTRYARNELMGVIKERAGKQP